MNSALLKLILIAAFLLGGCAPQPFKSPTAVDRAETSAPASTLPAENTDTPIPEPTQTPLPKPDLPPLTVGAGLLDGVNVSSIDADTITRYWIEIRVDFEDGSDGALIDGSAYIEYTNTTGQPLYDLVLRLWPNDSQYEAQMEAGPVFRDGRLLDSKLEAAGTVLRIPFSLPVEDGDTISIHVPFSLEVGSFHGGSPRRLGITQDVLIAPTFYPIIPRWLGEDWEVEQAPPGGDTTNSDTALYHLVINAPVDFAIAASGIEVDHQALGDRQELTFVSGPMRDFAFALGLFQENIRQVEGVSLRTWTLPEHEEDVDTLLESTALQFELLSEMVGPYPYPELDIVDAPGAFGGIEYPGLVYIGTLGTPWIVEPTVHEVAHQWFYALIGDDQVDDPWLDEGAATFATALYYEHAQGSGRGAGYLSDLRTAVRNSANPELPIGLPVGEYENENEYAVIVYFKGALFFETLRQRLGKRDFEAFLKAYYDAYRFGFADAAGFQAVAETTCSCELDDLFDLWVYEGGEIPSLTE